MPMIASALQFSPIPVDLDSRQDLIRLAEMLGCADRVAPAAGVYVLLWNYVCRSNPRVDGSFKPLSAESLARICGWSGDPDVLLVSLFETEIIERIENGYWSLSGWDVHARTALEKRKKETTRKRSQRAKSRKSTNRGTKKQSMSHGTTAGHPAGPFRAEDQVKEELKDKDKTLTFSSSQQVATEDRMPDRTAGHVVADDKGSLVRRGPSEPLQAHEPLHPRYNPGPDPSGSSTGLSTHQRSHSPSWSNSTVQVIPVPRREEGDDRPLAYADALRFICASEPRLFPAPHCVNSRWSERIRLLAGKVTQWDIHLALYECRTQTCGDVLPGSSRKPFTLGLMLDILEKPIARRVNCGVVESARQVSGFVHQSLRQEDRIRAWEEENGPMFAN